MPISVATIFRYPIKGLSPERMKQVTLSPGEGLPQDRRFAIAHASSRFDPLHPEWLPKTNFLMLTRDAKLAQLRTRFDEGSGLLTIERDNQMLLCARITDAEGRRLASEFFAGFLGEHLSGPPRMVEAPGHTFTDAKRRPNSTTYKYVSLENLASIRALENMIEAPVDPIRFRANFYLQGTAAWTELDWIGSEIGVGSARLRVVSAISRCAATHVNPATAERDLDIVGALQRTFGHINMGVYAEVVTGGDIIEGDAVALL